MPREMYHTAICHVKWPKAWWLSRLFQRCHINEYGLLCSIYCHQFIYFIAVNVLILDFLHYCFSEFRPMARASFFLCLLALVYLVTIQTCQAMLSYKINGEQKHSRTYEPFYGRPIPYKIDGVLVFAEFSKETPCTLIASNVSLAIRNKYNLKNNYQHAIVATEEISEKHLQCKSFDELNYASIQFGRQLDELGFPHMAVFLYFLAQSDTYPTVDFTSKIGLTALVLKRDYEKHVPILKKRTEPLLITIEQGSTPTNEFFSSNEMNAYRWFFVAILTALLLERFIYMAYLIRCKKFYFGMRNLIYSISLLSLLLIVVSRAIHRSPFITSCISRIAYCIFSLDFFLLLFVWSALLASVQAINRLLLFKMLVTIGCVLTLGIMILDFGYWFTHHTVMRFWASQSYFYVTSIFHSILAIIFAYCGIQFLLQQRQCVINSSTRQALKVLCQTSLIFFVSFILRSIGTILNMRTPILPSRAQMISMRLMLDCGDFIGQFAVLWVLGPQIAHSENWSQTRSNLSSILNQWLKLIRKPSNARNNSEISLGQNYHNARISALAATRNGTPVMSSHLSVSALECEEATLETAATALTPAKSHFSIKGRI
ncbi:hypothetical protein BDF19DRAFT_451119 [Syncephalis fuscata]|nr:hypothetical protein BDF19DRAFT_451119 [Syncephalis fuscata]